LENVQIRSRLSGQEHAVMAVMWNWLCGWEIGDGYSLLRVVRGDVTAVAGTLEDVITVTGRNGGTFGWGSPS
jgi:hypothetical protein